MESGFLVSDYLGEYRQKWMTEKEMDSTPLIRSLTENNYEDIARPALAQRGEASSTIIPKRHLGHGNPTRRGIRNIQLHRYYYKPYGMGLMENLNSQSHDRREFQPASWDLVMSISQTISFMLYSMGVASKISNKHTYEGKRLRMEDDISNT